MTCNKLRYKWSSKLCSKIYQHKNVHWSLDKLFFASFTSRRKNSSSGNCRFLVWLLFWILTIPCNKEFKQNIPWKLQITPYLSPSKICTVARTSAKTFFSTNSAISSLQFPEFSKFSNDLILLRHAIPWVFLLFGAYKECTKCNYPVISSRFRQLQSSCSNYTSTLLAICMQ